ncbi:MAG: hypothetical protein ACKKL4_03180 [Patescibacteria group bacterium]
MKQYSKQIQYSEDMATSDNENGFVILIAVLVSSLLISLGAFIASIAVKELSLSVSGRDSQLAFYAADAAAECALYQDLHIQAFTSSSSAPGPATLLCNSSQTPIVVDSGRSDGDTGVSSFEVSFPLNDGDNINFSPYAVVQITKDDIGGPNDKTIIESRGYNVKSTSTTNRVERALEVTY